MRPDLIRFSPVMMVAGALLTIPSTFGVVLHNQIRRARKQVLLPRPGYTVDLEVCYPWSEGATLRVAMIGDSLVEGVGAPLMEQSLPAQTAYRLAAHLGRPVHLRGYGVASSKTADVIRDQVPQLDRQVDLVIAVVGGNDATGIRSPWDFARDVEQLVLQAHARTGAPVVLTGLPHLSSVPLLDRPLRDVAGVLGDGLHTVQVWVAQRLAAAHLADVRAGVGKAFHRRRELFSPDRYHPGPLGYALLGEVLAAETARIHRKVEASGAPAQPEESAAA